MSRTVCWVSRDARVGCLVWSTADCTVGGGIGRWGRTATDGAGVGTGA